MPKGLTLAGLTDTLNRVRGMLVHYRVLGPDKSVVDQTLRELDDVEAVLAEAFEDNDDAACDDDGGGIFDEDVAMALSQAICDEWNHSVLQDVTDKANG